MSYQNPQKVVNRVFEAFANGIQENNYRQQQDFKALTNAIAVNKQRSQQVMNSIEASKLQFAYKLDSIDVSSNNTAFSDNLKLFFNDQVERYYQVKNAMALNKMDKREGQLILGQLGGQVQKFEQMIPEILSLANTIVDQAGKFKTPGGISSTTPQNIIDIFGSIGTGTEGGVYMVEEPRSGDLFFMKMPKAIEEKFLEDGKVDNYELANFLKSSQAGDSKTEGGSILNLDQMMKMGSAKSLIKYVPDMKPTFTGVTDRLFKPKDINSDFFTNTTEYNLVPEENKYEITTKRTVTTQQIDRMRQNMNDLQAFQTVLYDDNAMNSYWQDIMDQDTEYMTDDKAQNAKNRELARTFMIDQSIADMLLQQNLIKGEVDEDTGVTKSGPKIENGNVVWNPSIMTADEAFVSGKSISEVDKISPDNEKTYLTVIADETKGGETIKGVESIYDDIKKLVDEEEDIESRNKQINVILDSNYAKGVTYKDGVFKKDKKVLKIFNDDGELNERELLFLLSQPRMGPKESINFPSFFKRYKNQKQDNSTAMNNDISGLPGVA